MTKIGYLVRQPFWSPLLILAPWNNCSFAFVRSWFSSMTLYFSFIPAIDWWCMKPGVRKDRPTQTSPCILTTLAAWDWPWPRLQALRLGSACACPNSRTGQRFTLQDRRKTHENFNDCGGLEEDGHESAFCRFPAQKNCGTIYSSICVRLIPKKWYFTIYM